MPDAVVVTHGRIVSEAMAAKEELAKQGIALGIILLEVIKPYDECARNVTDLLPKGVGRIVFLEEEIRNGGFGSCLADMMTRMGALEGIKHRIVATDDSFVDRARSGQCIYAAAGVDRDAVISAVKEML